ncbi:helix-turn-helix domain-containing protein [Ammonicoccus fulvus]|uniref:Helix-turn-helix domain-containing protein n=1 Tax=Ammonicoccus fulvus TaxID=3138240 RepID=A0ABZ3FTR1_9ACTN
MIDFRVCAEDPSRPLSTNATAATRIVADHDLSGVKGADLVVIPATSSREFSPEVLDVVRRAYAAGATLLTVCSGAYVLAETGLLEGRAATSHWFHHDELVRLYPQVRWEVNRLFVDEDRIITSAGTAAGIDACLHLVRRELGADIATRIARRMVVPPQRDGGQQQFVEVPLPEHRADALAPLLDWVLGHLAEDHTVESLAARAAMSARTFARRFVAEVGSTPHQWLLGQRVLEARRLLEETELPIEQVAGAVGFGSAAVLRQHFRRATGLAPLDYRRRFGAA